MSNNDLTIILIYAIGTLLAQTFIAIRLDSAIYKFDLCKTNFYEQELRWKKDDNNKWVQYAVYAVNDRNPYGHGEKSAMMAAEFIHLTTRELILNEPTAALRGEDGQECGKRGMKNDTAKDAADSGMD